MWYGLGSRLDRIVKKQGDSQKAGILKVGLLCYFSVDAVAMESINSQEKWAKMCGTWNLKMKHHTETLGQTGFCLRAMEHGFFGCNGCCTRIRFSAGWGRQQVSDHLLCLIGELGRECERHRKSFIYSTEGKFSLSQMDDNTNLNTAINL